MSTNNISPEMMAMLDGELKDIQSKKRGFRTVRIEENDSWLIRYLPFEFGTGPSKPFFLKVANHWIMKRPYFCPRNSAPEVGGDPNARCAICDEIEAMCDGPDPALRKAGFKASATQQWLMYCFVFERELTKNRGEIEIIDDPEERWTPWEYWHSKWGFEEFIGIFRKCANRAQNKINVLDLFTGCNFWAASTAKGISLRREDSGPIADATPEEIQGIVDFAWSKIKVPTYSHLTDEQVDAALVKIQESARDAREKAKVQRPGSYQGFRESSDDGDLAPQAPRRPAVPTASTTRHSNPAPQEEQLAPQAPRTAAPQAPRAAVAPQVPRVAPQAPRAAPQAPAAPSVRPPSVRPEPADRGSAPRVAPPSVAVQRPAAPSVRPAPRVEQPRDDQGAGDGPPAPQAARPLGERLRSRTQTPREEPPLPQGGAPGANTIDDADNVTNEDNDYAPQADVPVDEAPPEVSAQGEVSEQTQETPAPMRINERLRSGIRTAAQRK